MNFQKAEFEFAAGMLPQLPESDLPEIVFSGKSNVGKSSLINKLVRRKALARVSATPGKTATINFFHLPECRLVDLPGYGYAKVSQSEKLKWASLVEGYLSSKRNIRLVIQIVDSRHAPSKDDQHMIDFLMQSETPFVVVCTKVDKLNKTQRKEQAEFYEDLFSETNVPLILFSAQTGEGLDVVEHIIEEACFSEE